MLTYNLLKVEDNILLKIEFTQAQNIDNLLPIVENTKTMMAEEIASPKYSDFAERLNNLMSCPEAKIKTVRQLQAVAGVTYEMARRYTLGTAKPRDEKLEKIAMKLGVLPSYLDYGTSDLNRSQTQSGQSQSQGMDWTDMKFSSFDEGSPELQGLIEKMVKLEAEHKLSAGDLSYLEYFLDRVGKVK